jgi:hypothetical protein
MGPLGAPVALRVTVNSMEVSPVASILGLIALKPLPYPDAVML